MAQEPPFAEEVIAPLPKEDQSTGRRPAGDSQWSRSTVVTVLAATLLVFGPIVGLGLPLEISQWHVAAAVDRQVEGDLPAAQAALSRAIEWSATNHAAYLARAELSMQQEDYQSALQDFERSLELSPGSLTIVMRRTVALQYLGRFDDAVAEWERLVAMYQASSKEARAMFLNGLAYARALAADARPPGQRSKVDLDKAMDEIERAIMLDRGSDPEHKNAAMIDTRGYIRLLRQELTQAEEDLDLAITAASDELEAVRNVKDYADEYTRADELRLYERALAVMLYHRAKLWEVHGQSDKAQADLDQVTSLGFTPGPQLF